MHGACYSVILWTKSHISESHTTQSQYDPQEYQTPLKLTFTNAKQDIQLLPKDIKDVNLVTWAALLYSLYANFLTKKKIMLF